MIRWESVIRRSNRPSSGALVTLHVAVGRLAGCVEPETGRAYRS
jgi:hypothetical protein